MLDWLFASPAERRLLGARPLRGPTPWVIAIMSFSMMIVAAAGLALAGTAGVVAKGAQSRYSVQIPSGNRSLAPALSALRASPGVSAVEAVPEAEMRRTLERWLGPAGGSADLPIPAIVNFNAAPSADLGAVERRVEAAVPGARVIAHRDSLAPLLKSLRLLQWLALALVLLLGGAAAAAVVLAARGALDTHRFTIEVMHGIGATDLQVTNLFQRKIAIDAFIGSVVGAIAAALVLLLLSAGAAFAGDLTGGATLRGLDLLVLAVLPVALTALATWVARTAVLTALREAL
ncbi:MAG: cell division transport system permease protein, partial [Sphingomonadales bacterium]|nr:cell division transport system permease protein [Sphingomonadales bacterium]